MTSHQLKVTTGKLLMNMMKSQIYNNPGFPPFEGGSNENEEDKAGDEIKTFIKAQIAALACQEEGEDSFEEGSEDYDFDDEDLKSNPQETVQIILIRNKVLWHRCKFPQSC